jgi:pilus assembly protein CpaC
MSQSRVISKKLGVAVLAAGLFSGVCVSATRAAAPPATAARTPAAAPNRGPLVTTGLDEKTGSLRILMNKSVTLTTSRPYKRLNVGEPEIAEVNAIGTTKILVTAKKAGSTQLIIWDEDDNSQTIDVMVQANLLQLRDLYARLMPGARIDVVDNDGVIALTGQVPTVTTADHAAQLASSYGNKVLNLLEVAGGQQVMLQIRFAEVSRSATTALGVNFVYNDGSSFGGSNVGQVSPGGLREAEQSDITNGASPVNGLVPTVQVTPAVTLFGVGTAGNTALGAFITALRENNLLRVLAEPNLVAISGQEADFLAGGDFPIPIVQGGSDQGTSITVEFREFGVRLNFLPVVLGDGRIRLKLNPEVSDVDFTNAVTAQGFRVPGRRTRRLSTTVELQDGQTFAVGGLLDNRVAANKSVTPLLGDLPVVGALFRSVRYQRNETELVVLVTPRLVRALNPGDVPQLPGEDWRHPSEVNLFLNGDLGGPRAEDREKMAPAPRRFIGNYGLVPATQPTE